MRAKFIFEGDISDLLKPKSQSEIIKTIFEDTPLKNANIKDMYFIEVNSFLGNLGERFLEQSNLDFKKINSNSYLIWGTLAELLKYYLKIKWDPYQLGLYLGEKAKLIKNEQELQALKKL